MWRIQGNEANQVRRGKNEHCDIDHRSACQGCVNRNEASCRAEQDLLEILDLKLLRVKILVSILLDAFFSSVFLLKFQYRN